MLAEALLEYEVLNREEIEGLMEGETVAEVRARVEANRAAIEKANGETPISQPAVKPKPDTDPEPGLPPGLAGEGA